MRRHVEAIAGSKPLAYIIPIYMTPRPRAREIRQTLISRFLSSFKSELEIEDQNKVYDDQFLIRMGQQAEKLDRSAYKRTVLMVIIDAVLLLTLSGHKVQVKIFGNELSSFPGLIEIGLFLTSVAYVSSVYRWLNFEVYKGLILSILTVRNSSVRPEIYMGSLFSTDYVIGLLDPKEMTISSNKKYFVMILAFLFLILSLFACVYIFHAIAFYFCGVHIWNYGAFGSLVSKSIVCILLLTNVSGYFLFIVTQSYPFRSYYAMKNDRS